LLGMSGFEHQPSGPELGLTQPKPLSWRHLWFSGRCQLDKLDKYS